MIEFYNRQANFGIRADTAECAAAMRERGLEPLKESQIKSWWSSYHQKRKREMERMAADLQTAREGIPSTSSNQPTSTTQPNQVSTCSFSFTPHPTSCHCFRGTTRDTKRITCHSCYTISDNFQPAILSFLSFRKNPESTNCLNFHDFNSGDQSNNCLCGIWNNIQPANCLCFLGIHRNTDPANCLSCHNSSSIFHLPTNRLCSCTITEKPLDRD